MKGGVVTVYCPAKCKDSIVAPFFIPLLSLLQRYFTRLLSSHLRNCFLRVKMISSLPQVLLTNQLGLIQPQKPWHPNQKPGHNPPILSTTVWRINLIWNMSNSTTNIFLTSSRFIFNPWQLQEHQGFWFQVVGHNYQLGAPKTTRLAEVKQKDQMLLYGSSPRKGRSQKVAGHWWSIITVVDGCLETSTRRIQSVHISARGRTV